MRGSLLLLRQPRYHRLVRYGFVRGNETVAYVREIEQHFEELKQMGRNARRVQVVAGGGGSEPDLADEGTTALAAPSMD